MTTDAPRCKHTRYRALTPAIHWCPDCGAHRRIVRERWTRWVTPGHPRRNNPLRTNADRMEALAKMRAAVRQLRLVE